MRFCPTRAAASLLIAAFVSASHTAPAFALRPAGLEEQSDESKREVTARLTELNAGNFPGGNSERLPNQLIPDPSRGGDPDGRSRRTAGLEEGEKQLISEIIGMSDYRSLLEEDTGKRYGTGHNPWAAQNARRISRVVPDPTGRMVAALHDDSVVRVWERLPTAGQTHLVYSIPFRERGKGLTAMVFLAERFSGTHRLVLADTSKGVSLYEFGKNVWGEHVPPRRTLEWTGLQAPAVVLAPHPNKRAFLSGSEDGSVHLHSIGTGHNENSDGEAYSVPWTRRLGGMREGPVLRLETKGRGGQVTAHGPEGKSRTMRIPLKDLESAGLEEGSPSLKRVVVMAPDAARMEGLLDAVKSARPGIIAEGIANPGDVGFLIEKSPDVVLVAAALDDFRPVGTVSLSSMEAQPLAEAMRAFEESGIPVRFVSDPDLVPEVLGDLEQDETLEVIAAVRTLYGAAPYAVGLRVGGNNVSAGLVNAQGRTEARLGVATLWRFLPRVKELLGLDPAREHTNEETNKAVLALIPIPEQGVMLSAEQAGMAAEIADIVTEEAVRKVLEQVRLPGLPPAGLKVVHIAFPGPVNAATGVMGDPYPAANVPGFDRYPMGSRVRARLQEELGVEVEVVVENDAPSGRKGEQFGGSGKGLTRVATFIWGTGMNGDSGTTPDGKPRWFELGHALVGRRGDDGKWRYRFAGAETSRPALEAGELELEQRLGGGAGLPQYWLTPAGFASGEEVTAKAKRGDAAAIRLIREAGEEFGRALAVVFARDYDQAGRTEEGILEKFVMVSGIAENLGLGVQDDQGRDLLVGAVRDGAREELTQALGVPEDVATRMAGAIDRSGWNSDREIAAAAEALQKYAAGLEEGAALAVPALPNIVVQTPAAREVVQPLRFVVDTGKGDARVLHLAQLAARWNAESGLPVIFAAVATEEEKEEALAQLPVGTGRQLLAGLIYTYEGQDSASHQVALDMALTVVPGLHPEAVITAIDRSTVSWFLQALTQLGIGELSQQLQDQIEAFITSA